jgi:hypothetical protein
MIKLNTLFLLLFLSSALSAQSNVEMADDFRGEGKIYIVVAVILLILGGIFYMLIRQDQRIKRLEKENEEKHT